MSEDIQKETRQNMINEMQEYIKTKSTEIYDVAEMTGYTPEQIVAIIKEDAGAFSDVVNVYVAFQTLIQSKIEDITSSRSQTK